MARIKRLTTAALAIAGVLCAAAIAQAADGAQWPNIYEPQWPTIGGAAGDKPVGSVRVVEPVPAPEPAPVAQRWHNFKAPPVISAFDGEFGLRYWYSWGSTKKDLYNIAGNAMVSRLSYDALRGHSAEGFGRVDHSSGFFIKGNLGAGIQTNGKLTDEDFPPFILPYSSTTHEQCEGHLAYATVDLGFNLIRRPGLRIGAFAGYHYLDQEVNAYGCNQIGPNPAICAGGIPDDILVITQNNQWHSLRIGMDADIRLFDRLSLRLDAAYLPYVKLSGQDTRRQCAGRLHRSRSGRRARPRLSARSRLVLRLQQGCELRGRRPLLADGVRRPDAFRNSCGRVQGIAPAAQLER